MSELDDLRKELQELKTQVSTVSRRLTELDSTMSDHVGLDWGETLTDINSPHPNTSVNTIESGGGIIRQDNYGMQVAMGTDGSGVAAIYMVPAFEPDPRLNGPQGQFLAGYNAGVGAMFSKVIARQNPTQIGNGSNAFLQVNGNSSNAIAQLVADFEDDGAGPYVKVIDDNSDPRIVWSLDGGGTEYEFEPPVSGAMKTSGGGYYLIPAGPAAGTTVASSASADTYGSWTELRSASGNALYIVGASVFIDDDSTLSYVQFDIGTGAAASESSVGEFKVSMNTHDSNPGGSGEVNNLTRIGAEVTFAYPIPVAASTRIACRTGDSEASSLSHAITLHVIDQADLVSL